MKGCPFCVDFKEMLTKEGIEFYDRDIDEYKDEYDTFSEITENDMIPALLIIEGNGKNNKVFISFLNERIFFKWICEFNTPIHFFHF